MIRKLFKLYPLESILTVFNLSIFSLTKVIGNYITKHLGDHLTQIYNLLPAWITHLPILDSFSPEQFINLLNVAPVRWLIVSIILTGIIHFIKGIFRVLLTLIILFVGSLLLIQYLQTIGLV